MLRRTGEPGESTTLIQNNIAQSKYSTFGSMVRGFSIGCPVGGGTGCLMSYFVIGFGLVASLACGIPIGATAGGLLCCGYFKRKKEVAVTVSSAPAPTQGIV